MVLGKLDIHLQKNEIKPYFTPHTKINSQWIGDLNVRTKPLKLLEENKKSSMMCLAMIS